MNITIVGAGAMGLLFGAVFARENPVFIEKDPQKRAAIAEEGYLLEAAGKVSHYRPRLAAASNDSPRPRLLLLAVKSYDTATAIREVAALIGPDTYVMTLQNGLGNVEAINRYVPKERLIAGATTHGAHLLALNRLRYSGGGETLAGFPYGGDGDFLSELAAVFAAGGHPLTGSDEIGGVLWQKTLVNAAINPLTALTGLKNGELLLDDELLFFMEQILLEGAAVAALEGVSLLQRDIFSYTKAVAAATAENYSSMLMDIRLGRRTEISAINGEICRRGLRRGLHLPYNIMMQDLILALEEKGCYTTD